MVRASKSGLLRPHDPRTKTTQLPEGGHMYSTHTQQRRHWRLLAAILLAAIALLAAACGDDDDPSSSPSASEPAGEAEASEPESDSEPGEQPDAAPETDSGADEEPDAEPTPEEESEPAADPVTVWVIEDSSEALGVVFPSVRAGIEARVARINSEGGLGAAGHEVLVEICVTDFDPNAAAECAREAAADPSTIAVAASVSANGDAYLPILEEAGLANVGGTAFGQLDGSSPVSFPTMGGAIAAAGCQATVLRDVAGIENFGLAITDSPGSDQVGFLLTILGVPAGAEVVTPVANTDYTAEIGALAADVEAIMLAQDLSGAFKVLRAVEQLGIDLPLSGTAGQSWTPANIASAGPSIEGMYLSLWYASDDSGAPGIEQYRADLEAIGEPDLTGDLAKMGWVAFELIHQLAEGTDVVDRSTILDGLNAMTAFDTGGIAPVLDFTTPGGFLGGAAPRFVNETCAYGQIQDGAVVGVSDGFLTPFTG